MVFGIFKKKTPEIGLSDKQKEMLLAQLKVLTETAQEWRSEDFNLNNALHMAQVWGSLASALTALKNVTGYHPFVPGSLTAMLFELSTTNRTEFRELLGVVLSNVKADPTDREAAERLLGYCYYVPDDGLEG